MDYKLKRPLKRLGHKEFEEDIKGFIKNTHKFYSSKIPEIKTLARKLHDEHSLEEFYKVFNKLWKSGYHNERVLAIKTLKLYKDDFDLDTWYAIKFKLKDIKDWDEIDEVSQNIVGNLILKFDSVKKDVFNLSKKRDAYLRRMALVSSLPLIKEKDFDFSINLLEYYAFNKQEKIQEAVGLVLKEISKINKVVGKKLILKYINMKDIAFNIATENMRDLRKVRKLKGLEEGKSNFDKKGLFSWLR
jgi:hypothetical protein